ncbi:response regulator transcription factor [[Mycobacterium] nativiensis]|uniref:Response regulator transcription factor n=1 Tax=[Mycobacterium] nativiensis TaxID=2855503 RepID=A0ABU5XVM4_9MYCO|nr:response regulator transcription factor [Mycolicibacter sp. MYC340]MEB3031797.1 response regulator transcription factor [Mycolicibacter sp. MYC340]
MRVLIVDDHDVVRAGLQAALSKRHTVVETAGTAAHALAMAVRVRPKAAVVDLRLPDMTGTELCKRLRELVPGIAVVILSTYVSDETVRRALDAGAVAYVTKAVGLREVLSVLDGVERGTLKASTATEIVSRLYAATESRSDKLALSPQQENVLELASEGLTNQEIGRRLYISESTVRFHLQNLKTKFEARTKTDLIARAIRAGVTSPAPEDAPS